MDSDQLQDLYLTGVESTKNVIGVGAYGTVFEVEFCGALYAAKQIHSVLIEGVEQAGFERIRDLFITECHQSSALGHPNVVQVLGVYDPGDQSLLPVLVMERMHTSLTSLVKTYPNIPMYVKLSILLDISRGLWYLHSHRQPIVHRDLSPNNVLLTDQFVAKISDLGVAKVIHADSTKTKTRAPGTVDFMAPEALQETSKYGLPLDVFSYGGVILHVVNQEWPEPLHYVASDPNTDELSALSEVQRRQQHICKMAGAPADLQAIVKQCLENKPEKRPLISDVSKRMKILKEAESTKCPDVDIIHIMKQLEQNSVPREPEAKPPPQSPSQGDIFSESTKVNWEEMAALPTGGVGHRPKAVLLHGLIYVGGGSEERNGRMVHSFTVHVLNPHTGQWNSSISAPCCDFGMTVLKDELVIAGGATDGDVVLDEVSVLGAVTGDWKHYSNMPTAKYNTTAIGYQSLLIIVGGVMPTKGILKKLKGNFWDTQPTTELLDTSTMEWFTCNNIPSPCSKLTAVILNNTLYMVGGADTNFKPSPKVFGAPLDDVITTHQLNWQYLGDLPFYHSTPVVLFNKYLIFVGGKYDDNATCEVRALNPLSFLWKKIADLPVATSLPAVVSIDNKLVVIGGASKEKKHCNTAWTGVFE